MQTHHEAAAATACALYFLCLLGTVSNIKITGFKLYIPLSISALVRTVAFATRAAYYGTGNVGFIAASKALQAIGLGISIAMCSCFLIIWLRNAQPNHLPVRTARAVTTLCKCLIGCIISMGPFLGIIGAALANVQDNDEHRKHGLQLRQASVTGLLILICTLTLTTAAVAGNWLGATATAVERKQEQHPTQQHNSQQQQKQKKLMTSHCQTDDLEVQLPSSSSGLPRHRQLQGDGLILVLLLCDALLLWSAAASLASFFHAELLSDVVLHYPLAVLPEVLVAVMFAWPQLAAKIALGARFTEWREEQSLPRQPLQPDGQHVVLPTGVMVLKDPLQC